MIRALPSLKRNLSAVFNNTGKMTPIYEVILSNYGGTDFKNLDVYASKNKNRKIKVCSGIDWRLDYQILDRLHTKYYYNNTIIKNLDNAICKTTVGDQVGSIIEKNDAFMIQSPTIIYNNNKHISRSSYLVFTYLNN